LKCTLSGAEWSKASATNTISGWKESDTAAAGTTTELTTEPTTELITEPDSGTAEPEEPEQPADANYEPEQPDDSTIYEPAAEVEPEAEAEAEDIDYEPADGRTIPTYTSSSDDDTSTVPDYS
jgi:hypothetical protein